jgi:transcriptional regulator with XRE-family HTH domain/tetratricopeptide (TPR) repeat protein
VTGSVPGRTCTGCGKSLSRYNPGDHCQACVSAARPQNEGGTESRVLAPHVDIELGLRLAGLRRERGLTQEQLAAAAGVSTETVRKLEQQVKKWARLDTLSALARALDVQVGELVGLRDEVEQDLPRPAKQAHPADYLPNDVLARDDFADVCLSRDLGAIFKIALDRGGPGFTISHLARRCEMTSSQVQDYLSRGRLAKELQIFERVSDGLHIPGRMMGIGHRLWETQEGHRPPGRPAGQALVHPWTVDGTLVAAQEVSEVNSVDRRSFIFLTGAAITSAAHDWLISQPIEDVSHSAGRTIGPKMLDDLDDMAAKLRHMDDQMGGGTLIDLVSAQARYVTSLIRDGKYTDSAGRHLHGTLGELLRLGGWVSFDSGHPAQAQRFWLAALHAAHSAGDNAMGANIFGFMGEQAWSLGKINDSVKLAGTAVAGYKGSQPRVSAILYMRAARAYAMAGDSSGCRRSIDSAYSAFRRTPPAFGEPGWSYWLDESSLNEQIGKCFFYLADYPSAREHLEISLRGDGNWQDTYARDSASVMIALANVHARAGELEQACKAGTQAIDILSAHVDSPRLTDKIKRLRDELRPHSQAPAVREFDERVSQLA